jgi:hypothetical protein
MAIPTLINGDRIKLRQACKNDAQYGLNITNWLVENAVGAPVTVADVATYFDTTISPLLLPLISNIATYWGFGCTKTTIPATTPEWYQDASRAVGTAGAGLLPTQSTPLISWRTDGAGPAARGRSFLPFPSPASINADGSLKAAFIALIDVWANQMVNQLNVPNAAGTGFIDLRRVITNKALTTGYLVIRWLVRGYMATQRRREELYRADTDPFVGSVHA